MTGNSLRLPLKYFLVRNDSGVWGEENLTGNGTPVVRSTDIALDGSWRLEDVAQRDLTALERRKARLAKDDIVVVTSSGSEQHLGKAALVNQTVEDMGACFSNFVQRIRVNADADPRFVRYLLNSHGREEMFVLSNTTTGLKNLNGNVIGQVTHPGVPREAQTAIADFLDSETARIEALIDKKRDLVELCSERELAALAGAFGTDVEWSQFGVPVGTTGHRCVRLNRVASVQTGLTLDSNRSAGAAAVTLPYLRVANVQDGWVNLDEVKEVTVPRSLAARTSLRTGDVLMTEGGDADKLGRGTVWRGQIDSCLHQNHVFAVRPGPLLLPDYLALLTRTPYARMYFELTASKTTGIASTSTSKIGAFRIPLLDLTEQAELVDRVQRMSNRISVLTLTLLRQIDSLKEHRLALVTAAVTGELDVLEAA